LFDSEADATARGDRLSWSHRLASMLLLPLLKDDQLHLLV
jgi:hypothetical protein